MKHSSSSSMSENYEVKATMSCNENWNILRNLYVDLFNLIVESRIPGINERGYGNGYHCPPLLGQNVHLCDLMKPECRKHQAMIHHLLRAVRHNVFEIEVLMLPDCCSDSKLSERIQNKEYILLERWSMTLFENSDKSKFSIEISELLRAVHSFLHFSQISAWLSSTKGKSPSNIYYWVKPTSDPSSTQFESSPEVHAFPLFKVNEELCGTVKVNYPTRKQYIPIIPCSKHPPLQGLRLRLTEDSNLAPAIPVNQQIVKHLHKNCDNLQPIISVKRATDPEPRKISSTTLLKTVTRNGSDISKRNRILKHSNSRLAIKIANEMVSNSCGAQIINKEDISSKSEASFFSNCQQTYSKCSSQENVCFDNSSVSKLNTLNKVLHPTCESNLVPVEISHQHTSKLNIPKCSSVSTFSNSDLCNISSNASNILLSSVGPSQSSVSLNSNSFLVIQNNDYRKSLKRKHFPGNDLQIIPNKRKCGSKEVLEEKEHFVNKFSSSCQDSSISKPFKRKDCSSTICSKTISNIVNYTQVKNCSKTEFNSEEGNDTDFSKSTSSAITCITSKRQAVVEKSKLTLENCLNQKSGNKKNHKLTDGLVKLKLVDLPKASGGTNQMLVENLDPDNCFSTDCDLVSDDLNSEPSKYFISKPDLSNLSPLNSSLNVNEVLMQDYKSCLNENNESVFNIRSGFQNISADGVHVDFLTVSKHCFINKSPKINSLQIQNCKVKKKYISDFYKPCRFQKLDLHQSTNICSSNKVSKLSLSKIVELSKSSAADSIDKNLIYSNISSRLSKRWFFNKLCKKEKSKSVRRYMKSNSLYLTQESEASHDKNVNGFVQKQILSNNHNSKIDISNNYLIQNTAVDDSLSTVIQDCAQENGSRASLFQRTYSVSSVQDSSKNVGTNVIPIKEKTRGFTYYSKCNVLPQKATPYLDCFPRHKLKFARGRKLLGNFEESILKGCLPPVSNVEGFHTEIGASGSFCPNHITLPANVSFYDMDNLQSGTSPYMAHVTLGDIEYYVPKKGAVQVTLFNPSETVVKMFVLNYDLSDMPPLCHTFIRQKTYYMPVGSTEDCPSSPRWLRFILHLRFASSKTGKLYLHKDFKIVVLNKSNDDAASEFNQEPRELRSFLHVPMNPTFSNF